MQFLVLRVITVQAKAYSISINDSILNNDIYNYEGRSEINASYFIMLAHDVRGEYC